MAFPRSSQLLLLLALAGALASSPRGPLPAGARGPTVVVSTDAADDGVPTDRLDDAWAARALADPDADNGWCDRCQDDWRDGQVAVCAVREVPVAAGAARPLTFSGGENGGVTLMGREAATPRVIYRVKAVAATEARARELAAAVRVDEKNGSFKPTGPETKRHERWSVEIKAWVPSASDVTLRAYNGPLAARGVHGALDITAINGPVSLVDVGGSVLARVQNGPLSVQLTGRNWEGAGLDAAAQNGPVSLVLPENYSARLTAGTVNGPRMINYDVDTDDRRGWFTATLGQGGAPVRVVTENGPFHMGGR